MAFNTKEQEIIKWGLQNGKTSEDVKKAITNYRSGNVNPSPVEVSKATDPVAEQNAGPSMISKLLTPAKEAVQGLGTLYGGGEGGIANKLKEDVQAGAQDIQDGKALKGVAKAGLRTAGDVAGAVYAPVGALLGATGVNKLFDKFGQWYVDKFGQELTNDKSFQEFATSHPNAEEDFTRALNIALAAADSGKIDPKTMIERTKAQLGINPPVKATTPTIEQQNFETAIKMENSEMMQMGDKVQTLETLQKMADNSVLKNGTPVFELQPKPGSGVKQLTKGNTLEGAAGKKPPVLDAKIETAKTGGSSIVRDIIPTAERFVNSEVTKALGLNNGDVKNISLSTGNEVGKFLADKNLIRDNLAETNKAIDDSYKANYKAVRDEIAKVKKTYTEASVPRYKQSLTEIKKLIQDVPGLEVANKEVDALLKKKRPTLADVQRTKELMDEHFQLYKVTGDVKETVDKGGLANIRKDLKQFIETEVQKQTGADIKELNNTVQTLRSIQDAVEVRSTKGLTKSMISGNDITTFIAGSIIGTPLLGLSVVLAKKLYESPSLKLKISKILDEKSDARKAKIMEDLKKGKVPKDIQALLRKEVKIA